MDKKFISAEEMLKKIDSNISDLDIQITDSIMTEMSQLTTKDDLKCHKFTSVNTGDGCFIENTPHMFSCKNNSIELTQLGKKIDLNLRKYGFFIDLSDAELINADNSHCNFNIKMLDNSDNGQESQDDNNTNKNLANENAINNDNKNNNKPKMTIGKACLYLIAGMVIAYGVRHLNFNNDDKVSEIDSVEYAEVYEISPKGMLYDMFTINSKYTDIQRQNMREQLKNQVVIWRLPVYEISKKSENKYRITVISDEYVHCNIVLTTRNNNEQNYLGSVKTGDFITIKGKLTGDTTMRSLEIEPAVLVYQGAIKNKKIIQGILTYNDGNASIAGISIPNSIYDSKIKKNCSSGRPCEIEAIGEMVDDVHDGETFSITKVFSSRQFEPLEAKLTISKVYISESSEPSFIEGKFPNGDKTKLALTYSNHSEIFDKCLDWGTKNASPQCPIKKNQTYPITFITNMAFDKGSRNVDFKYKELIDIKY